jgi:hypothetical protein
LLRYAVAKENLDKIDSNVKDTEMMHGVTKINAEDEESVINQIPISRFK